MIAIAISVLFGLIAFIALASVSLSVARGVARGQAILAEISEIDAAYPARAAGARRVTRQQPRFSAAA